MEGQRGQVTCLSLHSTSVVELLIGIAIRVNPKLDCWTYLHLAHFEKMLSTYSALGTELDISRAQRGVRHSSWP